MDEITGLLKFTGIVALAAVVRWYVIAFLRARKHRS